jgi:hypothetical protein
VNQWIDKIDKIDKIVSRGANRAPEPMYEQTL